MQIYEPSDDSYLIQESLEKYLKNNLKKKKIKKEIKILDMGSGSGIQAETAEKLGFKNILTVDINKSVVDFLKKQGFEATHSNLFKKIKKNKKFDLIIFNPPYLPLDKREPKESRVQTTAGKEGYEIILRFLTESKSHINNSSSILLLFSSLSQPEIILSHAEKLGYKYKKINSKKLFFEELYVYLFRINN